MGNLNDLAWKFGTFGNTLQNNLFRTAYSNGSTVATDLFAVNINRGRDHGLQPYVKYVKKCFNLEINSFSDLSANLMEKSNVKILESLYEYESFFY